MKQKLIKEMEKWIRRTFTETISGNVISRENTTINKVIQSMKEFVNNNCPDEYL